MIEVINFESGLARLVIATDDIQPRTLKSAPGLFLSFYVKDTSIYWPIADILNEAKKTFRPYTQRDGEVLSLLPRPDACILILNRQGKNAYLLGASRASDDGDLTQYRCLFTFPEPPQSVTSKDAVVVMD